MTRRFLCAVFVAVGWFAAVPAHGGPLILDQSAWTHTQCLGCGIALIGNASVAQTFTVGRDGYLVQIELGLYRNTPQTVTDLRLDLLSLSGPLDSNATGHTVLSTVIPASQVSVCAEPCGSTTYFGLPLASGIRVTPGEQMAIVLSRPGGATYPDWVIWQAAWFPGEGVDYAGGQAYLHDPSVPWAQGWSLLPFDYRFATFVEPVPEPASLTLLLIGLAGLGVRRLRR